ncbi:hypothetical protein BAXH7_02137 [Bacillus amyloliquefaciens XH7]|nr:hypothetical protein LL3_01438 [Bacillus amyloliquefaciens LL3]AEK89269.1 hypothetical protein BAXH7_02137 [Bacillus amyloliquefaciens XH7]KYC94465.1 hypothetical protein B425_1375 [Bacillus amyloliquefaciens]QBG55773.1 hypothetical protein D2M30_1443 [Bacillus amyloliquefaciens]
MVNNDAALYQHMQKRLQALPSGQKKTLSLKKSVVSAFF